jgi:hypothetical protein
MKNNINEKIQKTLDEMLEVGIIKIDNLFITKTFLERTFLQGCIEGNKNAFDKIRNHYEH